MVPFTVTAAVILLIAALYFFVLVRAYPRPPHDTRVLCDYAHRGLHGDGVPENSLAAFARAAEMGYGIELDVQLSADGEVMVFHDYTLSRMTGREGRLSDYGAEELDGMRLAGTVEKIPRFSEVLSLVDGRVPILVELKGDSSSTAVCAKTAELLKAYSGPYLVESFHPLLLNRMSKLMPEVYRGLLYTNVCKNNKRYTPLGIAVCMMAMNGLAKPNFIAYDKRYATSLALKITSMYKARKIVWTVTDEREYLEAKNRGELTIFEGFCPNRADKR